ncbi:MAG: hypothetical protein HUJ51_04525 [Eggerthellaceae bacterium]|nr:hypothetical protein [Eggerthellaceae bacterium]
MSFGYVIGIDGNVLIAATMGCIRMRKLCKIFSTLVIVASVCSLVFGILIALFIGPSVT